MPLLISGKKSQNSTTTCAFGSSHEVDMRVVILMRKIRDMAGDPIIHTTYRVKLKFGIMKSDIWY
jgi:hypothetical protein